MFTAKFGLLGLIGFSGTEKALWKLYTQECELNLWFVVLSTIHKYEHNGRMFSINVTQRLKAKIEIRHLLEKIKATVSGKDLLVGWEHSILISLLALLANFICNFDLEDKTHDFRYQKSASNGLSLDRKTSRFLRNKSLIIESRQDYEHFLVFLFEQVSNALRKTIVLNGWDHTIKEHQTHSSKSEISG